MPFNESYDVTVVRTGNQISFPMAGNGSVFDFGGALSDGNGTDDLAA
jgi:hypothetical protein